MFPSISHSSHSYINSWLNHINILIDIAIQISKNIFPAPHGTIVAALLSAVLSPTRPPRSRRAWPAPRPHRAATALRETHIPWRRLWWSWEAGVPGFFGWKKWPEKWMKTSPDGSMVLLYMVLHGSHQYTPFLLAYIPAPWIRHGHGWNRWKHGWKHVDDQFDEW